MSLIKLQGNASGTGAFTIAAPNSNTDRTLTLPDATGTVQVSGAPISGTTGTFTGLIDISAAGAGQITFPATQNPSSNGNTLDDYEEGSCTITLTDSAGNSATMGSNNVFRYIKTGRSVTVAGTLNWTSTASLANSSRIRLSGLPFQADGTTSLRFPAIAGSASSGAFNLTTSEIKFGLDNGFTFVWGTKVTGNNVDNSMFKADLGNSGEMYGFAITYFATT
jgi:hypothetical protein